MTPRTALLIVALATAPAYADEEPGALETIEVVGVTPLGSGPDADEIASDVQVATADDIRERGALGLADFMKRSFESVFVNDTQSNPLQPDVQYRGFVGSPLLGLPQGIAVYQDAARINEPFGDTVNWALVPESAIETVYLMPGSNPLFGLNALGGAISIKTKDGFTSSGTRAELTAGSFSRVRVEAEHGDTIGDHLAYFVTGSYLNEDGWRDYSPTRASQGFASIGWRSDRTRIDANLTYADTDLTGNGAAPTELLHQSRRAVFTRPDQTENALSLLNLNGEHRLSGPWKLEGNVYFRSSDITTYNGDDSDFEPCARTPGFICAFDDGGESLVTDANGASIAATAAVEGATINRTRTEQDSAGLGAQADFSGDLAGHENELIAGLAYDHSDIAFAASTELGMLDATRLAIGSDVFVADAFTRIRADTSDTGLFLTDTLSLTQRTALTLSARYNRIRIRLHDRLGTALNGNHTFARVNPSIGVTRRLGEDTTFYASYSESNRAPSPVELTCAAEDDPCRLPNAFVADPPLEQVVAATLEAGVRGRWTGGGWHAGIFRTTNEDDILFISAGALTNQGYFDNVGQTRRDGIELRIDGGSDGPLRWFANYTYLNATFRNALRVPSPNNPEAVAGEIGVERGDRLPLIPSALLKAGVHWAVTARLELGADLFASAGAYLRGDEGNLAAPLDGYALINVNGRFHVNRNTSLLLSVDNVLGKQYETFGLFGEAVSVLGDGFRNRRFLSPGTPRAAWVSVQLQF
jgi:iron complex outermembrane receptor protein